MDELYAFWSDRPDTEDPAEVSKIMMAMKRRIRRAFPLAHRLFVVLSRPARFTTADRLASYRLDHADEVHALRGELRDLNCMWIDDQHLAVICSAILGLNLALVDLEPEVETVRGFLDLMEHELGGLT